MWFFIFGFLISIIFVGSFDIPDCNILCCIIILIGFSIYFNSCRVNFFISGISLSLLITIFTLYNYREYSNVARFVGHDNNVIGRIKSGVSYNKSICRFILETESISGVKTKKNIKVSSYSKEKCLFNAGQTWSLILRIKPIYGNISPGANSIELNSIVNNIHASAYIVKPYKSKLIESHIPFNPFLTLQNFLWEQYLANSKNCTYKDIVAALIFGMQEYLSPDITVLFANMGISHLLAISGLHVGMVGVFSARIGELFWRLRPSFMFLFPAQYIGCFIGLICSFSYTALAGFGIPATRSFLMLLMFFFVV
jgi:predicted membrane metal-binding protein